MFAALLAAAALASTAPALAQDADLSALTDACVAQFTPADLPEDNGQATRAVFDFIKEYEAENDVEQPISQMGAYFPSRCVSRMASLEIVNIALIVGADGAVQSAEVIRASNRCIVRSSLKAANSRTYATSGETRCLPATYEFRLAD